MAASHIFEESMQKQGRSGLTVEWKAVALPASLIAMGLLHYTLNVPLWVLAALCAWIPMYYVVYPMVMRKKWTAFEKEFARRFQRGDHKQLLAFYTKQWFLRRFGPKAEMLGKLGLIYSALERHREAEQVVQQAIDATPSAYRERLYFNLANIKFELGKHEDAAIIYRSLKPSSPYRKAAQTQIALIDLTSGHHPEMARKILTKELPNTHGAMKERIERALDEHPYRAI